MVPHKEHILGWKCSKGPSLTSTPILRDILHIVFASIQACALRLIRGLAASVSMQKSVLEKWLLQRVSTVVSRTENNDKKIEESLEGWCTRSDTFASFKIQKLTVSLSAHRFMQGIKARTVPHSSLCLWPCYSTRMSTQNASGVTAVV